MGQIIEVFRLGTVVEVAQRLDDRIVRQAQSWRSRLRKVSGLKWKSLHLDLQSSIIYGKKAIVA
jgi:hypothetical protein